MVLATFRTECETDGERVPGFLKELDLSIKSSLIEEVIPGYNVCIFHIEISDSLLLATLKKRMEFLVNNDKQFTDLHRCHQTLQLGEHPNEDF